jgi:hypothetical protein
MKTTTLLRAFAFFIALAIFAGCTKDNLSVPANDNFAKSIKISETDLPVADVGSIKGTLYPAPSIVSIRVYNDAGFSVVNKPNADGSFLVEYLSPGLYNMSISYVVQNPENTYSTSFDVWGIEVEAGTVTSLGVVTLPWTY